MYGREGEENGAAEPSGSSSMWIKLMELWQDFNNSEKRYWMKKKGLLTLLEKAFSWNMYNKVSYFASVSQYKIGHDKSISGIQSFAIFFDCPLN